MFFLLLSLEKVFSKRKGERNRRKEREDGVVNWGRRDVYLKGFYWDFGAGGVI